MAGWDYQVITVDKAALDKVKVVVMIPHRDEFDYRAWRMWWDHKMEKMGCCFFEQRGFSLTTNRTRLVDMLLEDKDITHGFFLDDDVICPDNILPQLIGSGLPIACGLYMAKKKRAERGLAAWVRVDGRGYGSIDITQAARYVQVDVTGLGCALIQRQIFEKVPRPWFVWEPPPAPSEDFYFFEKVAATIGIKPHIDMTMKCRHMGVFVLDCDGTFETPEI